MKKRTLALLILVLCALLLWWQWPVFRGWRAEANTPPKPRLNKPSPVAQLNSTSPVSPTSTPPGATGTLPPRKVEMLHELAEKSNKLIQFYGLVIDQDGNPIPAVRVTLSIRTTKEPQPGVINDVFEKSVLNTDSDGRFALTDGRGALLSVASLEKDGYEASTVSLNRAHYWYWNDPKAVFHPNAARPEIFHMWKKAGAERLVRKGIGPGLRTDGAATIVDLLNGTAVSAGGDLRVSLKRDPQQITWGQTHYNWTVTIEAVNGGIIESADEQMYRAPVDGYQSKLVVHMPPNDPQWTDQKSVTLYLKLRGGKYYGRATLELMVGSDRQMTPLSITSFVNPSGGRNLEYDPLQDVNRNSRINLSSSKP